MDFSLFSSFFHIFLYGHLICAQSPYCAHHHNILLYPLEYSWASPITLPIVQSREEPATLGLSNKQFVTVPIWITVSHQRIFGSTCVSLPTLHILTMTAQGYYNRHLQDQEPIAHSADIVHNLVSLYHLLSQPLYVWSNTISHHCLAIQVVYLLLLSFIGSPTPIPATYTWTTDTKCLRFCHCW